MCMSCGCRDWDNDHGDSKNITWRRLIAAAEAGGVTIEEAVEHLWRGIRERNGPADQPSFDGRRLLAS